MSSTDAAFVYVQRHRKQAEFARTAQVEGHSVSAGMDWAKAFASRPGSADWKASCTCGWGPKTHYYGDTEALAACGRHLQDVIRKRQSGA